MDTTASVDTGPKNWRVRIRMYRKWLGDCFLLTFRHEGDDKHILIDCGALAGTPGGKTTIQAAAQHLLNDTGKQLAALVVTHEHWDHVSGFSDAAPLFEQFSIGEVWAAWTENPAQEVAKEKKRQRLNQLAAIELGMQKWNESGGETDQQMGAAVQSLLAFMPPGGLAAYSTQTNAAMEKALSLGRVHYLEPGDVVTRGWLPGVRAHVLGPPQDIKALHDMTGDETTDMYSIAMQAASVASATRAFAAAAQPRGPEAPADNYRPFDGHLQWDEDKWRQSCPQLAGSYGSDKGRQIQNDWLNVTSELALQLDSYTNNTSLVIAFQFDDTGEVLLFVGDAQIGNWLSWANVKLNGGKLKVSDLFAKTIFYKVGHHGSHNATLRTGGLELMKSPRLVAAIPVDEEFAHRPKGGCPNGWDMPAGPLLKAITAKTKGRVLRGDSDFPEGAARPDILTPREWNDFVKSVRVTKNYIEYFVI